MAALLTSAALILGAVVTAMVTGWRRCAGEPMAVVRELDGPSCYPNVRK